MIVNELTKRILSSIILIPLVFLIIIKGSYYFDIFLILCLFISIFEWHKMVKKKNFNLLGIFFLILSFFTIYKLRNSLDGKYIYLLFVTIICISTDIGGFLFGKLIKGPKLSRFSPNKTYSGMIGSFILTLLSIYLFSNNIYFEYSFNLTYEIIAFSIAVSAVSQFGDISISYFKRISKIKDTGKIIPGHGGLLDRIDGMIFAYPFSYLIISTTKINIF
tara:strand:+ start:2708 stop:3364 length:657 start_codon:yes stop_codon:yes gene_type:complete